MSEIKVNKISPATGTAITLGDSGDTFTVPSGATITNSGTATGFGGGGGYIFLNEEVVVGTPNAVTFDGDFTSDYDIYKIYGFFRTSANVALYARFRRSDADVTDSTYIWNNRNQYVNASSVMSDYIYGGYHNSFMNLSRIHGGTNDFAGDASVLELTIWHPLNTTNCKWLMSHSTANNGNTFNCTTSAIDKSAVSAISGITLYLASSATFSGDDKFQLYGIKNS
jgi:hypothetical protein|tara:strand:+ start:81 stop:755 length:675 start_codon:yes stop_codon:yes gene_type:complete